MNQSHLNDFVLGWFPVTMILSYVGFLLLILILSYVGFLLLILILCCVGFLLLTMILSRVGFLLLWLCLVLVSCYYDFVMGWFPVTVILSCGFLCFPLVFWLTLFFFCVFCRNCFCWNTWRTLLPTFMRLSARRYRPVRHEGCIKPRPSLPPFFASVWRIGASSCE